MSSRYLIVLTGIDGSGKTTQADLIVKSLKKDGHDVLYVWSRWDPLLLKPLIHQWKNKRAKNTDKQHYDYNELKSRKKKLLQNPVIRWLWLFLFFIDYGLQIQAKIRIRSMGHKLLVSDRIFYDSVIDQAINLGEKKEWLLDILSSWWMKVIFPKPDMAIYIDCPADTAFSRKDDAPNVEYLLERRKLYLELTEKYGWIKIDGTLPVDEIAFQVKDVVYRKLGLSSSEE